jgi:hypothetical protein
MTSNNNEYVICDVCKENLGDHEPYFAQEHLQKNPDHRKYIVFLRKTSL